MQVDDLTSRWQLARKLAREAGEITLRYFCRGNFQVETKQDNSPVTVADRQAEQHLRERIVQEFPGDAILGEEFGERPGESGYRWILDPIDGTKSFIHGVPLYGTLIGVEHHQQSVAGVIHIPALGESVAAAAGQGAWFEASSDAPRRAQVALCPTLDAALLCTSDMEGFRKVGRWDTFERLQIAAGMTRTWGDCYGYLLVATGRCDVMIDPRMHPWDAAALLPILQEAGGNFTDWQGNATIYGGNGIAANSTLLESVLEVMRR